MADIGIAVDLGTSGFRAQAIDLNDGNAIISTAITTRHPLPGANVMDHLHFAIDLGVDMAHLVIVHTLNRLIDRLGIERADIRRLAVCGNPIQLSLFEGIEVRDLAYSGKTMIIELGIDPPKREAKLIRGCDILGLDIPLGAEVCIPPAIRHEVGADALAMMLKSGMLDNDEVCLATDYGTNAEMALKVGEKIVTGGYVITGSAACGPALEGQAIAHGMLAAPGAISDVDFVDGGIRCHVLDGELNARPGDVVDPRTGELLSAGAVRAKGITGTGSIAIVSEAMRTGLIDLPRISTSDSLLHLANGIRFSERDLGEIGKAVGATRAGHITLALEAGIAYDDIHTVYMAGASGTYVDAIKSQRIGMVPAKAREIYQVGNTSLALARDLVGDADQLWKLEEIARAMRASHCMFALSETFKKIYILELAFWNEGMPWEKYQKMLRIYKMPPIELDSVRPKVSRIVTRDIPDVGYRGLQVMAEVGTEMVAVFEGCTGCCTCLKECPENAVRVVRTGRKGAPRFEVRIHSALCDGIACRRCELACPEKVFSFEQIAAWSLPAFRKL